MWAAARIADAHRYYNVIHEKCTATGLEPRTARSEVQVLGEELGIEPEPETVALFEQIKAGRICKKT